MKQNKANNLPDEISSTLFCSATTSLVCFIFKLLNRVLHGNTICIIVHSLKSHLQILYCIRTIKYLFRNAVIAYTPPTLNNRKSTFRDQVTLVLFLLLHECIQSRHVKGHTGDKSWAVGDAVGKETKSVQVSLSIKE